MDYFRVQQFPISPQPSQPSVPPTGFPPSQPIPQFPGGSPQHPPTAAPTAAPPHFIPQQPVPSLYAVDPGAISRCLYRNTYVWLRNGEHFWFYPTFVGRNSVSGFRWFGRFWAYYGIDLRRISTFTCF